jgi:competence protein ComEA
VRTSPGSFPPREMRRRAIVVACVAFLAVTAAAAEPSAGQAPPSAGQAPPATAPKPAGGKPAKEIDINKASRAELKTLPGIGDAEARKIIAGRPWLTKIDLVTMGVITEGTYASIKRRIVATQSGNPKQKK